MKSLITLLLFLTPCFCRWLAGPEILGEYPMIHWPPWLYDNEETADELEKTPKELRPTWYKNWKQYQKLMRADPPLTLNYQIDSEDFKPRVFKKFKPLAYKLPNGPFDNRPRVYDNNRFDTIYKPLAEILKKYNIKPLHLHKPSGYNDYDQDLTNPNNYIQKLPEYKEYENEQVDPIIMYLNKPRDMYYKKLYDPYGFKTNNVFDNYKFLDERKLNRYSDYYEQLRRPRRERINAFDGNDIYEVLVD